MNSIDSVLKLVRPDILALTPYSSARKEIMGGPVVRSLGEGRRVWLDANENPQTPSAGKPMLNRYPEPQPADLIARLAELYSVATPQLLVTRGSDEGIDLLLRTFCRAGHDAILITPPTYGMYVVAAGIQGARIVTAPLLRENNFAFDADAVLQAVLASPKPSGEGGTSEVKLVFLCSPNNPTGTALGLEDSGSRMSRIGRSHLLHGEVLPIEVVLGRTESITEADCRRVIERIVPHPRMLAAVGPSEPSTFAGYA